MKVRVTIEFDRWARELIAWEENLDKLPSHNHLRLWIHQIIEGRLIRIDDARLREEREG